MAKRHYDNQVETMMNYDKSGWPNGSMITQVETMMNYDKPGWPQGHYDNSGRNYDKLLFRMAQKAV